MRRSLSIILCVCSICIAGRVLAKNIAYPAVIMDKNIYNESFQQFKNGVISQTFTYISDSNINNAQNNQQPTADPLKTINSLTAQSNDWREPSQTSEKRYLNALKSWLKSLDNTQQEKARLILLEYHPILHALRVSIRDKKRQLASLSFDQNTSPETLPRLGQELQKLREKLREKLKEVEGRLKADAGIQEDLTHGNFWIIPPPNRDFTRIPEDEVE